MAKYREILKKTVELSRAKIKAYVLKEETYEFEGARYPLTQADMNCVRFRNIEFIVIVWMAYVFTVMLTGIKQMWSRLAIMAVICIIVRIVMLVIDFKAYKKQFE